jgi:quinolinate synthase
MTIQEEVQQFGYVTKSLPVGMDVKGEIFRLKQEKNAVILAHYYVADEIQAIADFVGDSFALAQYSQKVNADMIVFCGVHFMAETAKILCPQKKVLLPDLKAGCSLADSCPPQAFAAFKKQHPNHTVISYINCTAEIKALSDIICTSSNAEYIINSLPKEEKIIFAPDKNLGRYMIKKTGRDMVLWDGACMVHEIFSLQKITALKQKHPDELDNYWESSIGLLSKSGSPFLRKLH